MSQRCFSSDRREKRGRGKGRDRNAGGRTHPGSDPKCWEMRGKRAQISPVSPPGLSAASRGVCLRSLMTPLINCREMTLMNPVGSGVTPAALLGLGGLGGGVGWTGNIPVPSLGIHRFLCQLCIGRILVPIMEFQKFPLHWEHPSLHHTIPEVPVALGASQSPSRNSRNSHCRGNIPVSTREFQRSFNPFQTCDISSSSSGTSQTLHQIGILGVPFTV